MILVKFAYFKHQLIHTKEKPFEGPYGDLQVPTGLQGNGEPYACHECASASSQNTTLKSPTIISTKRNPYKCSNCEMPFSRNNHLKAPPKIHSKEKPYKCPNCEMSFGQRTTLNRHRMVHTKGPFSHTEEKPYKCPGCKTSSCQSGTLKRHQAIHTKGKAQGCDECGMAFPQNSDLKVHQKTHREGFGCNPNVHRKDDTIRGCEDTPENNPTKVTRSLLRQTSGGETEERKILNFKMKIWKKTASTRPPPTSTHAIGSS